MARFSVEIACRNCRGRLWRSEQEVVSNDQPGDDDSNSLKARQGRRQPCTCNRNTFSYDLQELGISPLFDDRAEEAIKYSSELRAEMPKREDRPDRVYGLRVTDRLSRLLHSTEDKRSIADGGLIGDNIRSSPFKSDGDPIIFPFFVIEAKSEKGSDAFTDTQVQTAFAIRELLSIQDELAQATGEDAEWDSGPLVWFLSYKGEQWRVSAAYMHKENATKTYRVVRLWSGGVDSLDSALQLLLIIDYIADWARDIYREGISRSLQSLAAHDSRSLACDDDVFSLAGNVRDWTSSSSNTGGAEATQTVEDPLQAFDCPYGAFRDARFIHTRFIGLIITEDNLDQFLRTSTTNQEARSLTASLLASIEDAIRVEGHLLDELELLWTHTERDLSEMSHPDEVFYVVATSVFYLTADWQQTRELSYVAVSSPLVHDLAKIARIPMPSTHVLNKAPMVTSLAAFGDLLNRGAMDTLSACVSRLCIFTGLITKNKNKWSRTRFAWKELPSTSTEDPYRSGQQTAIKVGPKSRAREFLHDLYVKHKVGRNEPKTSIFRLSSALDELATPDDLAKSQYPLLKGKWAWYQWPNPTKKGLVFVTQNTSTQARSGLCIFILDPSIAERGIRPSQLLSPPEYHVETTFYDKGYGSLRGWNMRDTVCDDKRRLGKRLKCLEESLRQPRGSPSDLLPTKWHILTNGWNRTPVVDQFEFTPNRPFRRRAYQSSLKATLLGLDKLTLPDQRGVQLVIEDDDGSTVHPGAVKETEETSLQTRESDDKSHEGIYDQGHAGRSPGEGSDSSRPSPGGKKRHIETIEIVDEAESSAHAARQAHHQQESARRFSRDFLSDEELSQILGEGGFT